MNDIVEILTKIYGYVNKIKVELAFQNIVGIWKIVNELSNYLVSIDVGAIQRAAELPSVTTIYTLCPNCHQYHPSNVACPENSSVG